MKKVLKYILLVVAAGFLNSCDDNLSDLNVNPDRSTSANPQEVLTSALGYLAYVQDAQYNRRTFLWAQYWTWGPGVAIGEEERYISEGANYNNLWSRLYANALADLQFIEDNEEIADAHAGIAKILKAYIFQGLVDHFGDVPFTEALAGNDEVQNFSPKFDDDEAIYTALIPIIDEGIAILASAETEVGGEDLVYGGDLGAWTKFANSLKLRILMRQSNVNDVQAEVMALMAEGNFIESASDNPSIVFADVSGDQNPMYALMESGVSNFYVGSKTSIDYLTDNNDPRLNAFYAAAVNTGSIEGVRQGNIDSLPFSNTIADYSQMTPVLYGPDNEVLFMSDWEVWFLRAEAAQKFGSTTDAETAFGNAINANFSYLGLLSDSASVAESVVFMNSLDYANVDNKVDLIGIQKWISMNGLQESEGWIESRRFNAVQALFDTPAISVLGANQHPSIWFYPASEISLNPNAPAQRTDVQERVFWDN